MTICAIAVALTATLCLTAQGETNRSWEELRKTVQTGKTVVVTPMSSGKVEGRLVAITGDTITVHWHGQDRELRREEVFRVRYANIRRRNTLIGLGGGAALGAIVNSNSDVEGLTAVAALAVGGIGAAVGGLLPIGKPLFEAERRIRDGSEGRSQAGEKTSRSQIRKFERPANTVATAAAAR